MPSVPDRSTFESIYAGQPPQDIGRPQKALIDVADQITGSILDAGCGTGETRKMDAQSGQHTFTLRRSVNVRCTPFARSFFLHRASLMTLR